MKYATVGAVDRAPDPFAPTYIPPNPIDPASPLPGAAPLPPGTTVTVGVENTGGWSLDKFGQLIGTGADLAQRAGVNLGPLQGFNFGAAFSKVAAAAAAGTLAGGPVGAVVGVLIALVSSLGGLWQQLQNPNWYAVGPGVHDWATRYAQDAFIQEAQQQGTNRWQTIREIAQHQLAWWLAKYGAVISGQAGRFYSGIDDNLYVAAAGGAEAVRPLYQAAGVDWDATREARAAVGDYTATRNVMMYKINVNPRGAAPVPLAPGSPVAAGAGSEFGSGGGGLLLLGGALLLFAGSSR